MTYRQWLRQQLDTRGISQRGLSVAAGVSLGRISAYLRGDDPAEPTLANARLICRALGVPMTSMDREVDLLETARAGKAGKPGRPRS